MLLSITLSKLHDATVAVGVNGRQLGLKSILTINHFWRRLYQTFIIYLHCLIGRWPRTYTCDSVSSTHPANCAFISHRHVNAQLEFYLSFKWISPICPTNSLRWWGHGVSVPVASCTVMPNSTMKCVCVCECVVCVNSKLVFAFKIR